MSQLLVPEQEHAATNRKPRKKWFYFNDWDAHYAELLGDSRHFVCKNNTALQLGMWVRRILGLLAQHGTERQLVLNVYD